MPARVSRVGDAQSSWDSHMWPVGSKIIQGRGEMDSVIPLLERWPRETSA